MRIEIVGESGRVYQTIMEDAWAAAGWTALGLKLVPFILDEVIKAVNKASDNRSTYWHDFTLSVRVES